MTMNEEQKIVENIFGPKTEYVELFHKEGEEAHGLLKAITRQGADAMLTTLLVSANLEPGKRFTSKPWGLLDDTYQLGDYYLTWSDAKKCVGVYELTVPSDPYSNV